MILLDSVGCVRCSRRTMTSSRILAFSLGMSSGALGRW